MAPVLPLLDSQDIAVTDPVETISYATVAADTVEEETVFPRLTFKAEVQDAVFAKNFSM